MSWTEIPIGQACELVNGRAFKPSDWTENGLPIVRIQNLNDEAAPFNRFNGGVRERFLIDSGELLFSWSGTPGTSFGAFFWHRGPAILNQHIFRVLVRDGVDANYFRYALNARIDRIIAQAHGGVGLQHITKEKLEATTVPMPSLPEQRRIAKILDKADAVRRKRKETIGLTEELLRSAFLEMFGDPVTNPKGWPARPLGAVADVQGGLQVTHARATAPIEVPYLRVANVYRDSFSLEEVKLLRVTESELERTRLAAGDVLVVEGHGNIEEVGRSAVWAGQIENCVHQNHLIRVRCGASVLPVFLSAFLNSEGGRRQMRVFGKTTSGLNTISTNNVRSTELLLPPIVHQRQYVALAERHKCVLERMREHELECDSLFDALVHRAFRGQLTRGSVPKKAQLEMFTEAGAE